MDRITRKTGLKCAPITTSEGNETKEPKPTNENVTTWLFDNFGELTEQNLVDLLAKLGAKFTTTNKLEKGVVAISMEYKNQLHEYTISKLLYYK